MAIVFKRERGSSHQIVGDEATVSPCLPVHAHVDIIADRRLNCVRRPFDERLRCLLGHFLMGEKIGGDIGQMEIFLSR